MMNKIKQISFLIFLLTNNLLFAQQADDIIGKYHLPNNLDIEIFKDGNTYSGKIIALNGYENGQTKDVKNSDKSKRNDLLINKVIITKLKFDKEKKEWQKGKMYGPEKGIFLNLKITEYNDNQITIIGSKFIFWKTMQWQKLK